MKSAEFDFPLPEHLIASRPAADRDASRLLVLQRDGACLHCGFRDIVAHLDEGDLIVLNNTKVFPARLLARRPSGGKLDILLVRPVDGMEVWEVLLRGRYVGPVLINGALKAVLVDEAIPGMGKRRVLRFDPAPPEGVEAALWTHGAMPLPPYIKREPDQDDKHRYQTIYARQSGSIAAPTAGLHFTAGVLDSLRRKGVRIEELTLHVGVGTFQPVRADDIEAHAMATESFAVPERLLSDVQVTKKKGRRVVTVGTTATRALEAVACGRFRDEGSSHGIIRGSTDIFIYPGFRFLAADAILTNFHLPRSTPLMLVSALRGAPAIRAAYKEAIAKGYRFFSYGDAMLIS
ncbi:MAG TPA: tRNA preQ1(34) S-adenosylmethionine ribosyltransferase-isomerase QueA [Dissulfurispiraceae bacterium]|nr:tRNA preQ1(34) S-adenosylmethionine ribosyltransferase-isomerase QueA [Dissulfurispiraceae bacterium]